MKIEHFSDFNCPYSYIGINRLKNAIEEVGVEVEWEMFAFELESGIKTPMNAVERYSVKNSLSLKEAKDRIKQIESIAENDGIEMNYAGAVTSSSRDAHRLVKYAQKNSPKIAPKLIDEIFRAHFVKNNIISDRDVLLEISESCGLSKDKITDVLDNESFTIEIEIDREDALLSGITATPCYIIYNDDEKLLIPGAISTEEFIITLEDLISGEIKNKTFI